MGSNSQGSGWRRIRGVSGHPLARLFGHRNKNHWSILGSKLSNEHPRVPWKHLWTALGSLQGVRGAREGDAARLVHHCAKLASDLHTVTVDCLILALQSLQMRDAMGCPFSYLHVAGFAQG